MSMRRLSLLLAVVVGTGALIIPLVAKQSCAACAPAVTSGVAVSGAYSVCVANATGASAVFTATERDNMKVGIETYWPTVLANTGTSASFSVTLSSTNCENQGFAIIVKADSAVPPTALAQANATSNGQGASIQVNPSFLNDYYGTGSYGQNVWKFVGAHELGHIVGFENVTTSGCGAYTVMMNAYGALPSSNCADAASALVKYPKRDHDEDGYSPDDPQPAWDCDDTDPNINPEYSPTCDVGYGQDFNCDDIDDLSQCNSPILVDVAGNGFDLTNNANGVHFDLDGDGSLDGLSWTAVGSDDAWLALDRDGNGRIDNGTELFGNWTPQPPSREPNGFLALAVFDEPASGGNGNQWFDRGDLEFDRVRLWRDSNHDGVSQPGELVTLRSVGVDRIALEYFESRRKDKWGNWFRYRARIDDGTSRDIGKFAYDVFLLADPGRQSKKVGKK